LSGEFLSICHDRKGCSDLYQRTAPGRKGRLIAL
jgi:hypothetical protein